MYAIKSEVMVGFSNGCVVLIPNTDSNLPLKFLNKSTSEQLCDLVNGKLDLDMAQKLIVELDGYLLEGYKKSRLTLDNLLKSEVFSTNHIKPLYKLDNPVKIIFVPTWRCNRSCSYCGVPKIDNKTSEERIDTNILMQRFSEAIDKGLQEITYHGGEPLIFYPPIFDQIKFFRSKNVKVSLSTKNYVSMELASKLAEAGLDSIQLSIDTIDSNLMEQFYRDKFYAEKLVSSIENLYSVGIKIRVNIVVSKLNYKGIPSLLNFLRKYHINKIVLSRFRKSGINFNDYCLEHIDQLWLYKEIFKGKFSDSFESFICSFFDEPIVHAKNRPICESGRIAMLILPNGQLSYCDFLCDQPIFKFGNIENYTVEELWYSENYNQMIFPKKEQLLTCQNCSELINCVLRGICYVGRKNFFTKDRRCIECFNEPK